LSPRDVEKGGDVYICIQAFGISENIKNLASLIAKNFNTKFYFEQLVNQYMAEDIPIANCTE
jgi:hypothetical protein